MQGVRAQVATLQLSAQQVTYRGLDSGPGFHSFLYLDLRQCRETGIRGVAARPFGISERPCPVTPDRALGELQVAADPGLQVLGLAWTPRDCRPLKGLN